MRFRIWQSQAGGDGDAPGFVARAMLDGSPVRATRGALQLVPGGGGNRAKRKKGWLVITSVALAMLAVLVTIVSAYSPERQALRALPDDQRRAVLSRTVDELRRFCGDERPDALKEHCRELASFAAQFEECHGDCEALTHRQLAPNPTR